MDVRRNCCRCERFHTRFIMHFVAGAFLTHNESACFIEKNGEYSYNLNKRTEEEIRGLFSKLY